MQPHERSLLLVTGSAPQRFDARVAVLLFQHAIRRRSAASSALSPTELDRRPSLVVSPTAQVLEPRGRRSGAGNTPRGPTGGRRRASHRFAACDRSVWHRIVTPVGRWRSTTHVETLLTFWPPGPLARTNASSKSSSRTPSARSRASISCHRSAAGSGAFTPPAPRCRASFAEERRHRRQCGAVVAHNLGCHQNRNRQQRADDAPNPPPK